VQKLHLERSLGLIVNGRMTIENELPGAIWFGQKVQGQDTMKVLARTNLEDAKAMDFGKLRRDQLRVEIGARAIFVPHRRWGSSGPGEGIAIEDNGGNQGIGFELSPFRPTSTKAALEWNHRRICWLHCQKANTGWRFKDPGLCRDTEKTGGINSREKNGGALGAGRAGEKWENTVLGSLRGLRNEE
jgi:hypothetical protein